MPAIDLATFVPVAGATYYLDTSALYPLAAAEAKDAGAKNIADRFLERAAHVRSFLQAVKLARGMARTSVLAMQEMAAAIRNEERHRLAQADPAKHKSWSAFKRDDHAGAQVADTVAQELMLTWMRYTSRQLGALQVHFCEPEVPKGFSVEIGAARKKAHRRLLKAFSRIDAMDALHIVLGTEMQASAFLSFDSGWQTVTTINVLTSLPPSAPPPRPVS